MAFVIVCLLLPSIQIVWIVTCVGSILLGLDIGLAVGLGIEMIAVVFRTQLWVWLNAVIWQQGSENLQQQNIYKGYIFRTLRVWFSYSESNNICPLFSSPHCCVLANISGTDIYRNRKDYVNVSHLLYNYRFPSHRLQWRNIPQSCFKGNTNGQPKSDMVFCSSIYVSAQNNDS